MPAGAKVWCWTVKVTYLCGCYVTGKTIHNCNSTMSNCSHWLRKQKYNKECEDCMLENRNGRNLSGKTGSSSPTPESEVEASGPLVEATEPNGNLIYEPIQPVVYTESGRKVSA